MLRFVCTSCLEDVPVHYKIFLHEPYREASVAAAGAASSSSVLRMLLLIIAAGSSASSPSVLTAAALACFRDAADAAAEIHCRCGWC